MVALLDGDDDDLIIVSHVGLKGILKKNCKMN